MGWQRSAATALGPDWRYVARPLGFRSKEFGNNPLVFAGTGITFGNVESFASDPLGGDPTTQSVYPGVPASEHEDQHTIQGQVLGPLYVPSYIVGGIASLMSGRGDPFGPGNWMEMGPYMNPPQPWP